MSEELIVRILNGEVEALIELLTNNLGVHPAVGTGIIGILKKDKILVIEAVGMLAEEINVDKDIAMIVAEIAMDSYNPDCVGINQIKGTVILALKKLIRKGFPAFPVESVDGLI